MSILTCLFMMLVDQFYAIFEYLPYGSRVAKQFFCCGLYRAGKIFYFICGYSTAVYLMVNDLRDIKTTKQFEHGL